MQKKKHVRGVNLTPLTLITLFILTRKKYETPEISFFVPNIPSFFKQKDKKTSLYDLLKFLDIKLTFKPKFGWIVSLKETYGMSLPVKVWLPFTFFVAIPQIKSQIKDKVHIKERKIFGVLYGYDISIDKITFWA